VIKTISGNVGTTTPVVGHLLSKQAGSGQRQSSWASSSSWSSSSNPGGLNGIWVSLKQFFVRWPYTS